MRTDTHICTRRRRPVRSLEQPEHQRTLHVIDAENLAGGTGEYGFARVAYDAVTPISDRDQVVVGCDASQAFAVAGTFPGRLTVGTGPDGADLALLGVLDRRWLEERFTRLVIGSGDHIFAPVARLARLVGLRVEAVSRPGSISSELYRAVDVWHPLGDGGPDAGGTVVELDVAA
jgi:hypothetical protein